MIFIFSTLDFSHFTSATELEKRSFNTSKRQTESVFVRVLLRMCIFFKL